jgi:hypothetical protein
LSWLAGWLLLSFSGGWLCSLAASFAQQPCAGSVGDWGALGAVDIACSGRKGAEGVGGHRLGGYVWVAMEGHVCRSRTGTAVRCGMTVRADQTETKSWRSGAGKHAGK